MILAAALSKHFLKKRLSLTKLIFRTEGLTPDRLSLIEGRVNSRMWLFRTSMHKPNEDLNLGGELLFELTSRDRVLPLDFNFLMHGITESREMIPKDRKLISMNNDRVDTAVRGAHGSPGWSTLLHQPLSPFLFLLGLSL